MVIFHSYVKLPEGNYPMIYLHNDPSMAQHFLPRPQVKGVATHFVAIEATTSTVRDEPAEVLSVAAVREGEKAPMGPRGWVGWVESWLEKLQ
jgi:hypothetical protein